MPGGPSGASFEACLVSQQRHAVAAPAVGHWTLQSSQNPHEDGTGVPVRCPAALLLAGAPGPRWGRGLGTVPRQAKSLLPNSGILREIQQGGRQKLIG